MTTKPLDNKDGYFMDDGARSERFAPYFVRGILLCSWFVLGVYVGMII